MVDHLVVHIAICSFFATSLDCLSYLQQHSRRKKRHIRYFVLQNSETTARSTDAHETESIQYVDIVFVQTLYIMTFARIHCMMKFLKKKIRLIISCTKLNDDISIGSYHDQIHDRTSRSKCNS